MSRFTTLAAQGDRVYAGLTNWSRTGVKLFEVGRAGATPVAAWPEGLAVTALTAFGGWLYGVVHGQQDSVLWRTDGEVSERIAAFEGGRVRDLAPADDGLWAVSARSGGGDLWSSPDGRAWTRRQSFEGVKPTAVTVYGGHPYMGAIGPDERGSLWGPSPPMPGEPKDAASPLVAPRLADGSDTGPALARPRPGARRRAKGCRAKEKACAARSAPSPATAAEPSGEALTARLASPGPDTPVKLFGGNLAMSAATVGQWYLLWGMGLHRAWPGADQIADGALASAAEPRREVHGAGAPRHVGGGFVSARTTRPRLAPWS